MKPLEVTKLHTFDPTPSTTTTIQWFQGGCRIVVVQGEDWWSKTWIVPRSLMLKRVRKLRQLGRRWADIESWELFPDHVSMGCVGHYGGPGQSYSSDPSTRRIGRRWYVINQRGGIDC